MATMTEKDELQRYERLLADWKPGPNKKPERMDESHPGAETMKAAQRTLNRERMPGSSSNSGSMTTNTAAMQSGRFAAGTIVRLHERSVALYIQHVPDKEYHLVLVLCPNGLVKMQGVALEGYECEELGSVPARYLDEIRRTMQWDRDMIVFHCYTYEDVRKVPRTVSANLPVDESIENEPEPSNAMPAAADRTGPRRGQVLNIRFGNNRWEAVYWGEDSQGTVVAHKTNNVWALMHLDLSRFGSDIEHGEVLPASRLARLEEALSGSA